MLTYHVLETTKRNVHANGLNVRGQSVHDVATVDIPVGESFTHREVNGLLSERLLLLAIERGYISPVVVDPPSLTSLVYAYIIDAAGDRMLAAI